MKTAVAEAREAVADEAGRRRRRSSAARGASGSSGSWPAAWPRTAAGRRSSAPTSATSSGPRAGATARSTSGAALETCADLFIRYGGHAGAAGFELADRALGRVSRAVPASSPPRRRRPTRASAIAIDLALPAREVDYGLYRELAGLAPCGPGNPDPLVAVLGLTVTRVRAATGGHSQLTLRRDRDVLDGIAFGRADIAETVHEGDRLDVVARLTSRLFGGFESLQLDIRDVATSGQPPEAGGASSRRPASQRRVLGRDRPP